MLHDVNSSIPSEQHHPSLSQEPLFHESTVATESGITTSQPQQQEGIDFESSTTTEEPLIPERKRSQFSYNSNELRRRHNGKTSTTIGGERGATTTATQNDESSSGTTTQQQQSESGASSSHNNNSGNSGFYECNICFDTATHPVLTLCGHLFCWSCLAQWLNAQSRNPTCPVCKAGCGKDKVIPVYGRGREEKDPRTNPSIPTRPAGQRPPPLRDPNQPGTSFFGQPFRGAMYNAGSNVAISAGIGLFPLGITLNIPATSNGLHGQNAQSSFLSRLILMIIILFLAAIIFY
ncbi:hypothetical protein BDA99DRAFT_434738 [Phascolomyces articulosus]|uniref:RING-type E3 ubiquitin transferase n=1 Tax=Phascolomyces articulosus TaxID=60185 RepID=A0AAD5KEP5_9FUNG|nr:hypothetical protein BDA99DRAFT_434738 [Phascolomyces articulosus]